ncbi:winged helix-turn-helix transcriptional regulator [Streptomyces sp. NPDC101733]|uniref:winged helix-turn-helix transcriptional regulator n=1 Tax=unclassified Streptomyces TaxID=2593676 RepID=UPI003816449D
MALADLPVPTADADLASAFAALDQKGNGIRLHTPVTRPARFGALHAAIGSISGKMLADRLREPVDAGLVTHARLPPGPATHTLTADGRALLSPLEQSSRWWPQCTAATATDPR